MEDLGGQGGIGEMAGAGEMFQHGAGVFKTAVGKFTFGAISIQKAFDSKAMKNVAGGAFNLTGALKGLGEAFTKAKLADVIADLTGSLYDARKGLEKTYGLFGKDRDRITDNLMDATSNTQLLGIGMGENMESFRALSNEFRDFSKSADLVEITSIMSKNFGISAESAAALSSSMSKFGGQSSEQIETFFDALGNRANVEGLSHGAVAESMASASKELYRFNLGTEKGKRQLGDMAIYASKIGVDMGQMIAASDKFRGIRGAMEASVSASRMGVNLNVNQLMASARGGDKSFATKEILGAIQRGGIDSEGKLNELGVTMADELGGVIGMDRDSIAKAVERMHGGTSLAKVQEEQKTMRERAEAQQQIMDRLTNIAMDLFQVIQPIINPLFSLLEWAISHTKVMKGVLLGVMGIWLISKAKFAWEKTVAATQFIGGKAAGGVSAIKNLFDPFGGKSVVPDNWAGGMGGKAPAVAAAGGQAAAGVGGAAAQQVPLTKSQRATFGNMDAKKMKLENQKMGLQNQQIGKQAKMAKAQSGNMLAGAVAMLAFGAAMIMLAKAFQMFSEGVDWKGVGMGMVVMAGFAISMIAMMTAMGTFATAGAPIAWAAVALMIAFGAAMMMTAKSTQWFADAIATVIGAVVGGFNMFTQSLASLEGVGLIGIGLGLVAIAGGLGAIVMAGGMLGVGGLLGVFAVVGTLEAIGNTAMKHASNIDTLSYAIMRLVEGLERLKQIKDTGALEIKIDKKAVDNLRKSTIALAGNTVVAASEIIQNHITIDMDGTKVARQIVTTQGTRGGR